MEFEPEETKSVGSSSSSHSAVSRSSVALDMQSADWQEWQALLWSRPELGDQVISEIVSKSKSDGKRFTICYGPGKHAAHIKLQATTQPERDAWVRAITNLIVYHLRMGFKLAE